MKKGIRYLTDTRTLCDALFKMEKKGQRVTKIKFTNVEFEECEPRKVTYLMVDTQKATDEIIEKANFMKIPTFSLLEYE